MARFIDTALAWFLGSEQGSTPATPAAGERLLYPKADGWYDLDDAGAETGPFGTGGGGGGLTVSTQAGTSYTFVLGDASSYVRFTAAGAVTATVPPNSTTAFPTSTVIEVYAAGAGGTTIAAGAGVTVNNAAALAQGEGGRLVKVATDEWDFHVDDTGGGATVGAWTSLTLSGSWISFGTPYATPAVRTEQGAEVVRLRGIVKSGTGTIANVAAAYRPLTHHIFMANGDSAVARIDVTTTGNITLTAGTGESFLSLDGLTWPLT